MKWEIVSDIIRLLGNYNDLDLNDTEMINAHNDLANIIDYMIIQKCSFKKALKLYREENDDILEMTLWIDKALKIR